MVLDFPNTGLTVGLEYTGDNGVTYVYDGEKWVGRAPAGNAGTNSIINGSYTVQVDGDGNLVIPNNTIIKYASGAPVVTGGVSTSTLVNGDFNFTLGVDGTINFDPSSANGKGILQTAADLQLIAVDKTWTFGTDGKTSLASGVEIFNTATFNFLSWNTGTALIIADIPYSAGSYIYIPSSSDTSGSLGIVNTNTSGTIMLTQGTGNTTNQLFVNNSGTTINNILSGISKTWTFGTDGSLTFPDSTVQTTAYTGTDTVTLNAVQTLNNKTLTSPTITDGVFQDTFSIGNQVFYEHGYNGFSVNENYDIVGEGNFTGYHYTSGAGRDGVAFTLARTGQFTTGFGIHGTAEANEYVIGSETANTDFVFKNNIGMPFDVSGGTELLRISNDGSVTFSDATVQTTAFTGPPTPPALASLLSTATTIAITDATAENGPSTAITVEITNHQPNHYGTTAYTENIISTGLVVIPDTTQSPPIDHSIMKPGTVQLTQTYNLGVDGSPANSHYIAYAYVVTPFGTVWSAPTSGTLGGICLLAGTMISLADGSYKAIEDITYTDSMLSWNFDQGCYAETKAVWIKRSETGSQYNLLTFSDGTTLRTFDQHRIFNKQAGAFTYPMTDATPIGTITVNEHGQEITLVDKQVIVDTIEYYNVITDYHMNLFSDSILTSCRFNNIYHITDMKFVKDGRTLRTRDEFENIPDRFFYGLRLAEQTTDIETVEWYVNRLLSLEQSSESVVV